MIALKTSWKELFQDNQEDLFDPATRRSRWESWKRLAVLAEENEVLNFWGKPDAACFRCAHLQGDWCLLADLPATVNPVLTIRHGMIGMACCGAGCTEPPLTSFNPKKL